MRAVATTWTRPLEALGLFLRGYTVRTATPIALVVGTLLSAVNHGDAIVAGEATVDTWPRVAFNYLVPFLVASLGFLSARRVRPAPSSDSSRDTSPDNHS